MHIVLELRGREVLSQMPWRDPLTLPTLFYFDQVAFSILQVVE